MPALSERDHRHVIADAGLPATDDWEALVRAGAEVGLDLRAADAEPRAATADREGAPHGYVVLVLDGSGHLAAGNSRDSRLHALADALETWKAAPRRRWEPAHLRAESTRGL